jgi:hydrogenase maturation factor
MSGERSQTNGQEPEQETRSSRSPLVVGPSCMTCSDQALPAQVLSIDQETELALVTVGDSTTEVDITLLDLVAPGDVLLVHGGVALERLKESSNERPRRL